jgi:hypothetical protein
MQAKTVGRGLVELVRLKVQVRDFVTEVKAMR